MIQERMLIFMEFKLYYCTHCGNIIFKVVDKGVPVMCCGQKMEELVPNTTDGALEKHVPVVEKAPHGSGSSVTVKVGSVEHPMLPEHYIPLIAAVTEDTVVMKFPKPGDKPELRTFQYGEGKLTAYELCNLHGFWKGEG